MFIHTSTKRSWTPTPLSTLTTCLTSLAILLLPSFVQHKFTQRPKQARRLSSTSFLDGLRGIAAVIVFFHHDTDYSANFLNHAYGTHAFKSFLQLPFLRLWCSGQPMVHIFFIISGYVLSVKPVRLIRDGQWDKLSESLASSAFRRWFRLFLPSIAGLAFFELTIALGLQFTRHGFLGRVQVLVYSWNWDIPHKGLLHLWTIPVEFSGSMFLFVVIIALSRLRSRVRMGANVGIIAYCLSSGHWGPAEFIAGMLLAEIEESLSSVSADSFPPEKPSKFSMTKNCKDTLHEIIWLSILIISLYIAGWSKYKREEEPILRHLLPLIPTIYYQIGGYDTVLAFPFAFAAFFIVWSLFRLPALQAPFTSSLAQYLGDISYSFYIVHDFLLIGYPRYWIALFANRITNGRTTPTKALVSVLFELSILLVIIIWSADVFWRFIDRPSVKFARWLESKCRVQESPTRSVCLA